MAQSYKPRWFHFSLSIGRYWSIGWTHFGFHLLTPMVGASYSNENYMERQGWKLGFWPLLPRQEGQYLYKYRN